MNSEQQKLPCIPTVLPIDNFDWKQLLPISLKATQAVARFDGALTGMVNPGVLLSPLTGREAVLSSRIEGTEASLVEVLQHEAGADYDEKKTQDIKEIQNYRQALGIAENNLKERPISLHLIRELHAVLMEGVRGGDKTPGQFRNAQNWIGKKGCAMEEARFIPPAPAIMQSCLENLQQFIEYDYLDPLVQLAIIHAQFEIIHPFNDGNGRLGRMLVPLFMYQKHLLAHPVFYLSEFFEETDQEYRDRLLAITNEGKWQEWIEFFLMAVHTQAQKNMEKANNIHALYKELKPEFMRVTNSIYALPALDTLFRRPILNATDFASMAGIKARSRSGKILKDLLRANIIIPLREASGRMPAMYAFPELINISEGREIFEKIKKGS